ncbi:MAG: biotin/lipoyl-binding protein [Chloroflexi bacterium]|nr:biotin/lipoyl-binding protein [Chloroflexota bacterium]
MQFRVRIGQRDVSVEIEPRRGSEYRLQLEGQTLTADFAQVGGDPVYTLLLDGKSYQFFAQEENGTLVLIVDGHLYPARVLRGGAPAAAAGVTPFGTAAEQQIVAPMPGVIVDVLATVGDHVTPGTPLVVIESMKMNNQLRAPAAGTVKAVHVHQGQRVERNQVLMVLA